MRILLVLCFTLTTIIAIGQEKHITKKGIITFEASVPLFEEVKATNSSVTAILNTTNGEIATLALVKGFRFKNALMEEHFNENYIESNDYPKATFNGKLIDFDHSNLKNKYYIEGVLMLHGKSKEIRINCSLDQEGDIISINSFLNIKPEDFDIKIPKIVSKKIADDILVSLDFVLKKK